MPFRVLIVEDKPDLRSLLYKHLQEAFSSTVRNGGWPEDWPRSADKQLEIEVLGEPALKQLVGAKQIAAVRRRFDKGAGQIFNGMAPDVVITDLALSTTEVNRLEKQGGTDRSGQKDPLRQLAKTSGFQVLRAKAKELPVIATTFASNPKIIEACWNEGAHAVIAKPATDKQMAAHFAMWEHRDNVHMKLTSEQKRLARTWGPRIETYLRTITQEVLKAVQASALRRIQSTVPSRLPYWLALNHERLAPQRIEGTSLTLLDIEGFSYLVSRGKDRPEDLFDLITEIWDQLHPVLEGSGAEINTFAGDAALIFRGVYGDEGGNCQLEDTLRCGCEASSLFEPDGPVRTKLLEMIADRYRNVTPGRLKAMENHVKNTNSFGLRVISIEPPEDEALYGRIGASTRWQHTIISRYFNLLKSAKLELDRWQAEERYEWLPGESFLISRKAADPQIPEFSIESAQELLRLEEDDEDEKLRYADKDLEPMELHRVFWDGANVPAR